jgi:alpha-beta hydrolase superfamily lysophospholipase
VGGLDSNPRQPHQLFRMDAFLLSNASTLAFIRFVLWHRSRCRPQLHLQRPAGTSRRPHHPAPHKTRLAPTCRASTTSPDRAVVILPGLGNNAADYAPLAATLQAIHGLHVEAAPVTRLDWARNASGLLDPAYYTGKLKPRPTVDWYLERVEAAINAARTALPGAPVTLLAHSAGGWLGRLFMLDYGTSSLGIDRFVSLGSPHQPPPEGVIDQTRGILTTISAVCPGAFHDEVRWLNF